jgi:hypothetical protein
MKRIGRSVRVALFLAVKALIRGNFGVTALTILLMALIFIDVLFLPALIAGAVRTIDRQIINTVTSDLVITSSTGTGTIDNVTALLAGIRTTNGVSTATATLRVGTQISHGSESNAWSVDAIDVSTYRRFDLPTCLHNTGPPDRGILFEERRHHRDPSGRRHRRRGENP